jgi:hypothetical protein
MTMVLKRKKLINKSESENYSEAGIESVSRNEILKCFMLPPSSLSNIILQRASILEEESWCGANSGGKKITLLKEQGSVPNY